MNTTVQTAAIRSAVGIFFLLALVSACFGCSPAACAGRALLGAAVMYVAVKIAGRLIITILIRALAENQIRKNTRRHNA